MADAAQVTQHWLRRRLCWRFFFLNDTEYQTALAGHQVNLGELGSSLNVVILSVHHINIITTSTAIMTLRQLLLHVPRFYFLLVHSFHFVSTVVTSRSNQLTVSVSATGNLCRSPSESIASWHSFTMWDISWTIPHSHLLEVKKHAMYR